MKRKVKAWIRTATVCFLLSTVSQADAETLKLADGSVVEVDKVTRQEDGLLTITGREMRKFRIEELSDETQAAYALDVRRARATDAAAEERRRAAEAQRAARTAQVQKQVEARKRENAEKAKVTSFVDSRFDAAELEQEQIRRSAQREQEFAEILSEERERVHAFVRGLYTTMPEREILKLIETRLTDAKIQVHPRKNDTRILLVQQQTLAGLFVFSFNLTSENQLHSWSIR